MFFLPLLLLRIEGGRRLSGSMVFGFPMHAIVSRSANGGGRSEEERASCTPEIGKGDLCTLLFFVSALHRGGPHALSIWCRSFFGVRICNIRISFPPFFSAWELIKVSVVIGVREVSYSITADSLLFELVDFAFHAPFHSKRKLKLHGMVWVADERVS